MKAELIVAMDVPDLSSLKKVLTILPDEVRWVKVGLELFIGEGPDAIRHLRDNGKNVFLDLKLHDIPRTVANAVSCASSYGVKLLTVHASGGRNMLTAAAEAAKAIGDSRPLIVAVTTLTSLDENDLKETGIVRPIKEHTLALGELAISSGIDGLVCSPLEVGSFRKALGDSPVLVTPGIRPADSAKADQKRIATPKDAVRDGSSFLVVGRPILQAKDPREATLRILKEIE